MCKDEKFLAIIPARSGSKGLADKNIKDLNGKPMIAYTIEAAKNSGIFSDVIVSTDSERYAEISEEHGGTVPFLRPKDLSSDTASSLDVIEYTITELKKRGLTYDFFMLLQPTSPLRDANDIRNAVNLLSEKKAYSVVSVCETEHSPLLMNTLDDSLNMDNFIVDKHNKRRQELSTYYRLNGAIYLSDVRYFQKFKSFYREKSYAYIMDQKKSIDVDSWIDFELIRTVMNKM